MTILLTKDEMLNVGISYRQLDHWTNQGYVRCNERAKTGPGTHRRWPYPERRVAALMDRLIAAGLTVEVAARAARAVVETGMPEVEIADGITLMVERR